MSIVIRLRLVWWCWNGP